MLTFTLIFFKHVYLYIYVYKTVLIFYKHMLKALKKSESKLLYLKIFYKCFDLWIGTILTVTHAFGKFNSQMAMGSFVTVVVKSLYTLSYLKQLRSKSEIGEEKEKW